MTRESIHGYCENHDIGKELTQAWGALQLLFIDGGEVV